MKCKLLFLLVFFTAFSISESVFAQSNYEDVVYLKNGSIIHGMIIEQVPNESLKIQTKDKNIFVFKMDEILKITKEEVKPAIPLPVVSETPVPAEPVKKEKKKNGYTNITELTFARSFSQTESFPNNAQYPYENHFDNLNNGPCLGIKTVNGYQFNPYLSIGAGIGMQAYNDLFLVPFFFDVHATFIDGPVSPFVAGEIGNSFTRQQIWGINSGYNDEGGFMGSVMAGVKFFPVPRMGLNFSIGFNYQEIRVENEYSYGGYTPAYSDKSLNQFTVRAGFTF